MPDQTGADFTMAPFVSMTAMGVGTNIPILQRRRLRWDLPRDE